MKSSNASRVLPGLPGGKRKVALTHAPVTPDRLFDAHGKLLARMLELGNHQPSPGSNDPNQEMRETWCEILAAFEDYGRELGWPRSAFENVEKLSLAIEHVSAGGAPGVFKSGRPGRGKTPERVQNFRLIALAWVLSHEKQGVSARNARRRVATALADGQVDLAIFGISGSCEECRPRNNATPPPPRPCIHDLNEWRDAATRRQAGRRVEDLLARGQYRAAKNLESRGGQLATSQQEQEELARVFLDHLTLGRASRAEYDAAAEQMFERFFATEG